MAYQETTTKADYICDNMSKKWLCSKLNLTLPTLNRSLDGTREWKLSEAVMIEELEKRTKALIELTK